MPVEQQLWITQAPYGSTRGRKWVAILDIKSLIKNVLYNVPTSNMGYIRVYHSNWGQKVLGTHSLPKKYIPIYNPLCKSLELMTKTLNCLSKTFHLISPSNRPWKVWEMQGCWLKWLDSVQLLAMYLSMPSSLDQCKSCWRPFISSRKVSMRKSDSWLLNLKLQKDAWKLPKSGHTPTLRSLSLLNLKKSTGGSIGLSSLAC